MAQDGDVVLRLLREIRIEQSGQGRRLINLGRQFDEWKETMANSVGWSAHAATAVAGHGSRFDDITDEIAAPEARVSQLEGSQ